jgi:predicted small metal-binding protein
VLHCECGFEARAADEDGLVANVQRHAREAHSMALSREEALLLVEQLGLPHDVFKDDDHTARTTKEEQ